MILVRDSNKLVARAVMQSPKLFDHEVENFASMKDICEEALRIIALNRKFVKVYAVVRALVNNPRTPIDVGLQLLPQMHDHDLKGLVLNRNVSDVIRHAAERIIERKERPPTRSSRASIDSAARPQPKATFSLTIADCPAAAGRLKKWCGSFLPCQSVPRARDQSKIGNSNQLRPSDDRRLIHLPALGPAGPHR